MTDIELTGTQGARLLVAIHFAGRPWRERLTGLWRRYKQRLPRR